MIIDLIGKVGYAPGTDTILNGSYIPPEDKLLTLQILCFKNLQWKNKMKPKGAPTMINADQIEQGFKQWNERTSKSPSNRYLGHYKCLLVANDKHKKDGNEDISNTM